VPPIRQNTIAAFAPAKINLTLRVLGRRADGYHEIESLVVFADAGDRLTLTPGPALSLSTSGPTAEAAGIPDDNLVLKAARAFADRVPGATLGRFRLAKQLPVAAGLGGGSSDAAAALRLLAETNGIPMEDARLHDAARVTGADVPVCLDPRARMMRGIGDILSEPLDVPKSPALLVNPGVPVPTKDVFAALRAKPLDQSISAATSDECSIASLIESGTNDLEGPAVRLQPVIAQVLTALRTLPGCRLARMSGSGATCFALFESARKAEAAARSLRAAQPNWWVQATQLG
jgi:4-diphosphocytidyl-2-C-methyl-D-erythritol kinase